MQHGIASCQLPRPRAGVSSAISTPERGIPCQQDGTETPSSALVRGAGQEVAHTASRRTGPRRRLRVVTWLIGAGLHPTANATTMRIAEDLAARMDYGTGHVRYCLDEMVARLGISKPTIKRHVAALRELGALAWVVHGTRTNVRRALGLKGYAGTATVYAATIPPVYDRAMGHRIIGSGYTARALAQRSVEPVDNSPVDSAASATCEPPSLWSVEEEGKLKVEGGRNYTSRQGATCPTASIPHQSNSSSKSRGRKGSTGRSPLQVLEDIRIARHVRARVNWTQREGLRRLAFALRPLIDQGLGADQITAEVAGMCLTWRPAAPAAFLRIELARRAATAAAHTAYELENCAEGAFTASDLDLIADVVAANLRGIEALQARAAAEGWDDFTGGATTSGNDAAADFAALLGGAL